MVTANKKSTIDIQTNKKKQSKHNTKDSHQTTREEGKKKEQQKQIQNSEKNGSKNIHINNDLKCKWTKCPNQETDWLNGYKTKIHIYVVFKGPPSVLGTDTN